MNTKTDRRRTAADRTVVPLINASGTVPSTIRDGVAVPNEQPLVAITNISKKFGAGEHPIIALDDVSIRISDNEFFTLLGPSGCGKTTLLRLLAGFEYPSSGSIAVSGSDLISLPPNKRQVNTVFQSYALFPHMTIEQNVAFGLERKGLRGTEVSERVREMLALVQLQNMATRRPDQLSGGQQQRVALARALAPYPRLLLLDEPLSALDLKLRRNMQVELKRLQRETGITFVLVTHDQEEALSMSDRIAVMSRGKVLQIGTPAEIYRGPNCRFVADFIGEANVFPGDLAALTCPYVAIRPEQVLLADSAGSDGLRGTIADITYLGSTLLCTVNLDSGHTIRIQRGDLSFALSVGQVVRCVLPPAALIPLED